MDLFKLLGTIAIDGVEEAKRNLDDVGEKGENTKKKLSFGEDVKKSFEKANEGSNILLGGVGLLLTAASTLSVGFLGIASGIEQGLGGAEAVFGEFVNHAIIPIDEFGNSISEAEAIATGNFGLMEDAAVNAYKNMGLSTNDYLGTINKMGSLFKGAGFETEEALTLSNSAMQRAADVASIMGIDVSAAMESITGAAKGNFTMMDNLGVAINDTTLQNYALSQGIKKSTQDMTSQEKVSLAMKMFMDKTAYATGNYAKENKTLSGSLSTLKANISNAGASLVKNLMPPITNFFNKLNDFLGDDPIGKISNWLKENETVVYGVAGAITVALLPALINLGLGFVSAMLPITPFLAAGGILGALFKEIGDSSGIAKVGLTVLAIAVGTFTAVMLQGTIASKAFAVAEAAKSAVTVITSTATTIATKAQELWNIAISANPVMALVTVLTFLVGGIIAVTNHMSSNKDAVNNLKDAKEKLRESNNNLKDSINSVKDAQDRLADSQMSVEGASLRLERAQNTYNEAVKKYGTSALETREALYNMVQAQNELTDSKDKLKIAEEEKSVALTKTRLSVQDVESSIDNLISKELEYIEDTKELPKDSNFKWDEIVKGVKDGTLNAENAIKSLREQAMGMLEGVPDEVKKDLFKASELVTNNTKLIQDKFNSTNFSFNKPRVPKFSMSGEFNAQTKSVPQIGISWNALGGIMKLPTIFGFDGKNFQAGGEVPGEQEAILPLNAQTLGGIGEGIVRSTSEFSNNREVLNHLSNITAELTALREQQSQMQIILDSGELVGGLKNKIDQALDDNDNLGDRGVAY